MMKSMPIPTTSLRCLTSSEAKEVRDFLRESGYTIQALKTRFGQSEIPHVDLLSLYRAGITLAPGRLNTLLRWFWIGSAVEAAAAREFIPEPILQLFLDSGMLAAEDGRIAPPFRISPFNQLLILSDHAFLGDGALHRDAVLWPNQTTRLCYNLAMRTPVSRTLDLGTGNGVLALAAASFSTTVVATDLNPRARLFCEFNAALNGITNVEFREGSVFEPVEGERFDLILANPPFFVTPTVRRVFSDNSMELDGFCRMLVRQAPQYLTENGCCQMLAEWVQMKGQSWRSRVTEWVTGIGCDAWVTAGSMKPSVDYAMMRALDDRERMPVAAQLAEIQSWEKYFEERQVQAICGGTIVLRRREGRNWTRLEEILTMPERPFGEFMRRIIASRDFLDRYSNDQLLDTRPRLSPSVRLDKQFAISPAGWQLASVDLQQTEGLPYSFTLQPAIVDSVALCNGERTVGEIADLTAASLSVDPVMIRLETCAFIRTLADRGMIAFAV
jgi:hypothetical protein